MITDYKPINTYLTILNIQSYHICYLTINFPLSRYKFTFTFTKGTRSVSKDVKIRIMPGSPPIVRLRPLKSSKVNADEKVVLKGYVDNPTRNAIDVWWECLNDEDGMFLCYLCFFWIN